MASFENLENGRVRASVYINGIRDSKTLPTKQKARSWARDRESELSKLESVVDVSKTFGDLFKRYADKISSRKKGAHWEQVRKWERVNFLLFLKSSYPLNDFTRVPARVTFFTVLCGDTHVASRGSSGLALTESNDFLSS